MSAESEKPVLIEIHMIQNFAPSNVNRDDLGAPKTCIFGGVPRARISSQCIKRSIRNPQSGVSAIALNMKGYLATRTKQFPELVEKALEELATESSDTGELAKALSNADRKSIVDAARQIGAPENKKKAGDDEEDGETAQLISLMPNEVRRFVATLLSLRGSMQDDYAKFLQNPSRKGGKDRATNKNRPQASEEFYEILRRARTTSAVDTALFGRMTTSPAFDDFEAAMEVAHAISTHEVQNQIDYFTAVDDLAKGSSSSHIGEKQENSATYYKYFSLDWNQLIANLRSPQPTQFEKEADADFTKRKQTWEATEKKVEELAVQTLGHFVEAAACVIPSGTKKGHANNNLPDGILIEIKYRKVPTSYANAFADPVARSDERGQIKESVARLGHYVGCVANGYKIPSTRLWFSPIGLPLEWRDIWSQDGEKAKPQAVATPVRSLQDLVITVVEATRLPGAQAE